MNIELVGKIIGDKTKLEILSCLRKKSSTYGEVFEDLKKKGLKIKYQQTVYRALEKILEAGLVDKKYVSGVGLVYSLKYHHLYIDLDTFDIMGEK